MAENEAREALDITVKGVVQGVGFRPFVFRCAQKFHLTGWVLNALDGVTIHVEGTQNDLDCFAIALVQEAPEAANVKELELNDLANQNTTIRGLAASMRNPPLVSIAGHVWAGLMWKACFPMRSNSFRSIAWIGRLPQKIPMNSLMTA